MLPFFHNILPKVSLVHTMPPDLSFFNAELPKERVWQVMVKPAPGLSAP